MHQLTPQRSPPLALEGGPKPPTDQEEKQPCFSVCVLCRIYTHMERPLIHRIVTRPPQIAEQIVRDLKGPLILLCSVFVGTALYGLFITFLYLHPTSAPMPAPQLFYEIGHAAFLHSTNASGSPQSYQLLLEVTAKLKMTPRQVYLAEALYIGLLVAKLLVVVGAVWCVIRWVSVSKRRASSTQ
jgi:hypothetical protein